MRPPLFVVELRLLLFIGIVLVVAVAWLLPPLGVWLHHRKAAASPTAGVGPALEQAPVGVLVLGPENSVHFANYWARKMLDLSAGLRTLPTAEWAELLVADRLAARAADDHGDATAA